MLNQVILQLYDLRRKHKDDIDAVNSIDEILKNLLIGMAAVTDIIAGTTSNDNNIKH